MSACHDSAIGQASQPPEVLRHLLDVQERVAEPGVFLVGKLHFTELHDVTPSDALRLHGHPRCDVDHRGNCCLLSRGAAWHSVSLLRVSDRNSRG